VARYLFQLTAVTPVGSYVRLDSASGSTTPTAVSPIDSAYVLPGAVLRSDAATGELPRVAAGVATLYQKTLNAAGGVTATATLSGTLVEGPGPGALPPLTFPIPVNTDPTGLNGTYEQVYVCPAASGDTTGATDTAAIQTKLTAAGTAGGGKVVLRPGTYWINAHLSVESNTEFCGTKGSKLKLAASITDNLIQIGDGNATVRSNVYIHDLELDGNQSGNTDPGASADAKQCNINAWDVDGLEIARVDSHDAIYHGIFVRDSIGSSKNISIHHNKLHDNGYRAVHIHGSNTITQTHVNVSDNLAYNNGTQAGAGGFNTGIFVAFANMAQIVVSGNIVHDEVGYGINITGTNNTGSDTTPAERATVTGNVVYNCGHAGILVTNGFRKLTLADNISSSNGTVGLVLQSNANTASVDLREVVITGNQLVRNAGIGLQIGVNAGAIYTMRQITISDNIITDNGSDGIKNFPVAGSVLDQFAIRGNILRSNVGRAIRLDGTGMTISSLRVAGNHSTLNTGGFLTLTNGSQYTVDTNFSTDDTASSSGNTDVINLASCANGAVIDNRIIASARTNSGRGMVGDSSCSAVSFRRNRVSGLTGAEIAYAGTGKWVQEQDLVEELVAPANGYTLPRMLGFGSALTLTAGTKYAAKLRTRRSGSATGVQVFCSTAFVGATDLRVALFSSDLGTKLGESANLGNPSVNTIVQAPFAGGAVSYAEDTWYWVVITGIGQSAGAVRGLTFASSAFTPQVDGEYYALGGGTYAGGSITATGLAGNNISFAMMAELY
jgi:hypothetical protein